MMEQVTPVRIATPPAGSLPGAGETAAATPRDPTITAGQPASPRDQRLGRRLALALIILTTALYGYQWTRSGAAFGDALHHVMNGIFVFDAAREAGLVLSSGPVEYGFHYYRHYPAVNLGYYPPVFAVLEALLMGVFGVSIATGQLTVLLLAVLWAWLTFAWLRLRFDVWWAAGTTAALVCCPLLVLWGRDVMIEIPSLAFMTGAVWCFERVLRDERPRTATLLLWVAFSAMAFWTKQHTLLLLGVYGISILAARRLGLLRDWRVIAAGIAITAAAACVVIMTLNVGGDAVGHTVGFTGQHAIDRINLQQWTRYARWLPTQIVGWPVVIMAALGLYWTLRGRERLVSPLLAWIVVFYIMHSYFKAQTPRYACLWVPPFFVLAAIGLRHLPRPRLFRQTAPGERQPRAFPVGALLMVLWVGASLVSAAQVEAWHVPNAYQRAAEDLCDRPLAPFSCLTFFPDRPGRMALCHRLAVEERRGPDRGIYAFGRIMRAKQLIPYDWRQRWGDVPQLSRTLREWNIKYILTETPRPIDPKSGHDVIAEAVDGVVALGDYREVSRYTARMPDRQFPDRQVILYERTEPMQFNPDAGATLRTGRAALEIPPTEVDH